MRHRHRTDQVRPAVGLAPPHRPIADDPDAAQEGRGRPGRHPGRTGTDGIAERPGLFPARASLSFALAYRRNEADPSVFSPSLSPSSSRLLDGTPRSTSSEPLESPESTFSATEGKDRQTDDVGLAHGGQCGHPRRLRNSFLSLSAKRMCQRHWGRSRRPFSH